MSIAATKIRQDADDIEGLVAELNLNEPDLLKALLHIAARSLARHAFGRSEGNIVRAALDLDEGLTIYEQILTATSLDALSDFFHSSQKV